MTGVGIQHRWLLILMLLMRVAPRRREDELAPLCTTPSGDAQAQNMSGSRLQTVLSYVWALCPLPDQSRDGPELCPVLV